MEDFIDYQPPNWDAWFMKHVYLVAEKSKDPRTKIGAVIVRERHIISSGFNGFPVGVIDSPEKYNDRETKYKYVVHAEDNSVLTAARFGIPLKNAIIYTQGLPCHECMKSIIQAGIDEVIIHKQWPIMTHSAWKESTKVSSVMMGQSGVKLRWINRELGMNGYLDGKIIKV